METLAIIFFILLLGGSILVGLWLEKGKYRGKI
jgi:hypothetical protein